MSNADAQIILFTYDISVFSRKIAWYLALRGIRYSQCVQPNRLPRPDLFALGISYRKIPILAIGRDVYCDTRVIIDKLEALLPEHTLGSKQPFEQGLEKILSTWSHDGGPFWRATQCIPHDLDIMQDPMWVKDRSEAIQSDFTPQMLRVGRPEALVHQKIHLDTIEHGLLADGRDFVLGTEQPTLADLHAVWVFDWLTGESMKMGEHMDPAVISEILYPRVYSWIRRFRAAVDNARDHNGSVATISGTEAIESILSADFWEKEGMVDELDPLQLRKGQVVEVYPTDFGGHTHRDRGHLVSLSTREVVIESPVSNTNNDNNKGSLRLHFPRINFRIEPV